MTGFSGSLEEFSGTVQVSSGGVSLGAIGLIEVESGVAYVVEEGIVQNTFGYSTITVGAEANVSAELMVGRISVWPGAGKTGILGESGTGGLGGGLILNLYGASLSAASEGNRLMGHSTTATVGISAIPFTFGTGGRSWTRETGGAYVPIRERRPWLRN